MTASGPLRRAFPLNNPVSSPEASITESFAALRRGDLAPEWVRAGLVSAWGFAETATVSLIVVSENVTFRVEAHGHADVVVRLARPGYAVSTAHIRSELIWIEALRNDTGISTPSPVRGLDGDMVQLLIDDANRPWSAVAFEFAEGTVLEDHEDISPWFREIGTLTAMLHRHARSWSPPPQFQRFEWLVPNLVGSQARWGDWRTAKLSGTERQLLERAEERARAIVADGLTASDPRTSVGLIHADLRPSNVLVGGEGLTIIDFDDCGYGYYLYDFAAALTFYEHRHEAYEMASAWFDGYRSGVSLSSTDLKIACALSMLRRLTMLGWATTHRADALPEDLWTENQPGTVDVAARFLANPRWLVKPL